MLLALMVVPVSAAQAQSTTSASLAETLQSLMQQVEELQARLAELRGEVKQVQEEIRNELREGMTGEEVQKLQELLASDPDIYPEGLRTGYFGPLTRGALSRFQARHELEQTGEVDEATRNMLNEYFKERGNGEIPPGLLRAPGIRDKVERRMANDCEDGRGMAFLCERLQGKYGEQGDRDKDRDRDRDRDRDDDDNKLEIEVEIEDGEATVEIEFPDGTEIDYLLDGEDVDLTDEDAIIASIANEHNLTEAEVAAVIEIEYDDGDDDNDDDEEDEEDDDDDDEDDEDDSTQS